MPNIHPKGLAACLYAAIFLLGVLGACNAMTEGNVLFPALFLAVWPGVLLAATVFFLGSPGGAEATAKQVRAAFIYGEIGLAYFVLTALFCVLAVTLWPLTIGVGIILFLTVLSAPTAHRVPVSRDPVMTNHPVFSIRPYPAVSQVKGTSSFHLPTEAEENYERRFHFAMEMQHNTNHRG
ncbi:MAG TPA: hypothetical protein VFF64_06365 [Candidatus Eremiobacteraceae bacterium]|nr:hypothetical protein [Candidatus Eremiobacteraceae bacterium]